MEVVWVVVLQSVNVTRRTYDCLTSHISIVSHTLDALDLVRIITSILIWHLSLAVVDTLHFHLFNLLIADVLHFLQAPVRYLVLRDVVGGQILPASPVVWLGAGSQSCLVLPEI